MVHFILAKATLVCLFALSCSAVSSRDDDEPTVTIDTGGLRGITTAGSTGGAAVTKFLGVPYGKPPGRWKLPERAKAWEGVRDASEFGHSCFNQPAGPDPYSKFNWDFFNLPAADVSEDEDCLYLNVYVPESAQPFKMHRRRSEKAVMFWIHGGADELGSASLPLYDATSIASNQDVIVVTINYRLAVLGFPGSPDIPQAEQNFGLHDQRLALDWVQRNIRAFGGDPERVTIFGESAGARSVDNLITAPPQPVPFYAAIMESTEPDATLGPGSGAAVWKQLAGNSSCTDAKKQLECMRNIPASKLMATAALRNLHFHPYPDNGVTFANYMRAKRLASKVDPDSIARVPVMVGSNADESSVFLHGIDPMAYFQSLLGNNTGKLFLEYARPYYKGYADTHKRDEAIATDLVMTCPTSLLANDSMSVGIPTWRYFYNASFANTDFFAASGAYHSADIRPIFGTEPSEGATPFQMENHRYMQKAWADFAKNPTAGPGWGPVHALRIIGGGARPGESDEGRRVAVTVDSSAGVDSQCDLYQSIYKAASVSGTLDAAIKAILGIL